VKVQIFEQGGKMIKEELEQILKELDDELIAEWTTARRAGWVVRECRGRPGGRNL
jgi:hypothetical protein